MGGNGTSSAHVVGRERATAQCSAGRHQEVKERSHGHRTLVGVDGMHGLLVAGLGQDEDARILDSTVHVGWRGGKWVTGCRTWVGRRSQDP